MQPCDIGPALDLVSRRWALRVVRELALGPKRFTDLSRGMAGISTNVLAARLRELQQANVVQRRLLPPPAASTVYELTECGRELDEVAVALSQWGTRSLTRSLNATDPQETL